MGEHARLGCSNKQWPSCPGSVRAQAEYPDVAGDAAIDGTGTHLLIELHYTEDKPLSEYEGTIIGANHEDKSAGWLINQERIDRAQIYIDYVERRGQELAFQFPDGHVIVSAESRANPGKHFGRDDWWGTCDLKIVVHECDADDKPTKFPLYIESIDYKDGRGWVSEVDNSQLIGYVAGGDEWNFYRGTDDTPVRMTIVQPKTNPSIRYQDSTRVAVCEKLDKLADAAKATDDPNAPLIAGNHCQWCKHKPNCTAGAEQSLAVMQETSDSPLFEQVTQMLSDPKALTGQQLADLADAKAPLVEAFGRIETEIQARIETGEDIPGYAMMPGRSSNVWSEDEGAIVKMLKGRKLKQDDIYPRKLISVAQVLKHSKLTKQQREKIEKEYVTTMAGKLSLKRVARRKKPTADEMFANVKPTISFM